VNRRAVLVGTLLLAAAPLWARSVPICMRVTDPVGGVLPGAEVTLLGAKGKPIRTLATDKAGLLVWEDPPLGDSRFRVSMPGFYFQVRTVTVHSDDYEEKLEVTLQPNITDYYQVGPAKHHWWQIFH
jgi:hypothetical protein